MRGTRYQRNEFTEAVSKQRAYNIHINRVGKIMTESRVPNISKSLGLGFNSQILTDEFGVMSNFPLNETLSEQNEKTATPNSQGKNVKSMPAVSLPRTPRVVN